MIGVAVKATRAVLFLLLDPTAPMQGSIASYIVSTHRNIRSD